VAGPMKNTERGLQPWEKKNLWIFDAFTLPESIMYAKDDT